MDIAGAELAAFVAAMFAFTNPFILPVPFIELSSEYPKAVRRPFAMLAVVTQLITFLLVTWLGADLLDLLGVSTDAITVAGAILILSFGIPMAMGTGAASSPPTEVDEDAPAKNWKAAAVSPVGIPILAGGAHFALIISTTARFSSTQSLLTISAVCVAASAITLVALLVAEPVFKRLGDTGMAITVRVFGFIVMALGFDVLATGLNGLFPGLTS